MVGPARRAAPALLALTLACTQQNPAYVGPIDAAVPGETPPDTAPDRRAPTSPDDGPGPVDGPGAPETAAPVDGPMPPDAAMGAPADCPDWWDPAFTGRHLVAARGEGALAAGRWVSVTIDHAAMVRAGAAADGADVRVVRQTGGAATPAPHFLDESSRWNDAATRVWFRAGAAIPAGETDRTHAVYFGNRAARASSVAPSAIVKRVRTGTAAIEAGGSVMVALDPAVDPARTALFFSSSHASDLPGGSSVRLRVAGPTALELAQTLAAGTRARVDVRYHLIEYASGVRVRRGVATQDRTPLAIPVVPPVAARAQAFVTWSKTVAAADMNWDYNDPTLLALAATDVLQSRTSGVETPHQLSWEIVEYLNAADLRVERGVTSVATRMAAAPAVPVAADPARAFPLVDFHGPGDGDDIAERVFAADLSGGALRVQRLASADSAATEIGYQIVELLDGTRVHAGLLDIPAGDATVSVPLVPPVDPARSVAFATVQAGAGQSQGATDFIRGDVPGHCSARLTVTGPALLIERARTGARCLIGHTVLELPATGTATVDSRCAR